MRRLAGYLGLAAATVALAGCGGAGGGYAGSPATTPATTAPPATAPPPPTAPPATITPPTAPPATGNYEFFARDFVGTWSGSVGTTSKGADAVLTLRFDSPVDQAAGRAELPALGCVGSALLRKVEQDGRYVFGLDWQQGTCAPGTFWLRPLDPKTVGYHFEDGAGGSGDAVLHRS